jgi:hypothetical protein
MAYLLPNPSTAISHLRSKIALMPVKGSQAERMNLRATLKLRGAMAHFFHSAQGKTHLETRVQTTA